jgi:type II secretory pathway pseudopilin PulG
VIRRGALLLETMLALAIFVIAAAAVLSLVDGSVTSLRRATMNEQAADLARTAMAKLEAGIATPQGLDGPVYPWLHEAAERGDAGPAAFDEDAQPTGWVLEVDTTPSQFTGLTRVTVRAVRRTGDDRELASYTLRQTVRLGSKGEDKAGEADALLDAISGGPSRGATR